MTFVLTTLHDLFCYDCCYCMCIMYYVTIRSCPCCRVISFFTMNCQLASVMTSLYATIMGRIWIEARRCTALQRIERAHATQYCFGPNLRVVVASSLHGHVVRHQQRPLDMLPVQGSDISYMYRGSPCSSVILVAGCICRSCERRYPTFGVVFA